MTYTVNGCFVFKQRMLVEEYLRSPINHPSFSSKVRPMFDLFGKHVEYLFIQQDDLWVKVKDGDQVCILNGSPSVVC
jgi:hypothetical protein